MSVRSNEEADSRSHEHLASVFMENLFTATNLDWTRDAWSWDAMTPEARHLSKQSNERWTTVEEQRDIVDANIFSGCDSSRTCC